MLPLKDSDILLTIVLRLFPPLRSLPRARLTLMDKRNKNLGNCSLGRLIVIMVYEELQKNSNSVQTTDPRPETPWDPMAPYHGGVSHCLVQFVGPSAFGQLLNCKQSREQWIPLTYSGFVRRSVNNVECTLSGCIILMLIC